MHLFMEKSPKAFVGEGTGLLVSKLHEHMHLPIQYFVIQAAKDGFRHRQGCGDAFPRVIKLDMLFNGVRQLAAVGFIDF